MEVPELGKSELAFFLVREVVWGAMSPQLAVKVATLSLRDMAAAKEKPRDFVFKDLEMLSGLPTTNTYRTLLERLGQPFFPLGIYQVPMQLNGIIGMWDQCALWPHAFSLLCTITINTNSEVVFYLIEARSALSGMRSVIILF